MEMENCLSRRESGINTDIESVNTRIINEECFLQHGNEIKNSIVFFTGAVKETRDVPFREHKDVVRGNGIFILYRKGEVIFRQICVIPVPSAENTVFGVQVVSVSHGVSSFRVTG